MRTIEIAASSGKWVVNANSGIDGEIMLLGPDGAVFGPMPFDVILMLVAEYVRGRRIADLERMDARELLGEVLAPRR